jgi:hypothetical protein
MILTSAILKEAEKWLGCIETSSNRSKCVDEIHTLFYDGWKGSADAWCAKFVYAITDVACNKLKVPNPLYKSASTVQMLNNTQLRKDSEAAKVRFSLLIGLAIMAAQVAGMSDLLSM